MKFIKFKIFCECIFPLDKTGHVRSRKNFYHISAHFRNPGFCLVSKPRKPVFIFRNWSDHYHVIATEKVAEEHILIKCYKCNTFQVIIDLVHDFRNFNILKIILKIYKQKMPSTYV